MGSGAATVGLGARLELASRIKRELYARAFFYVRQAFLPVILK
jgi:hypothetical protein